MPPHHKNSSKAVPKAPDLVAVKQNFDINDGISGLNLNENKARKISYPIFPPFLTRNRAEQLARDSFLRADKDRRQAPGSSKEAYSSPVVVNCAPPQTIQVARFPKDQINPIIVQKQTVDVTADRHQNDDSLNNVPDFRAEWGNGERWKNERKVDRIFVTCNDIPEFPQLHGWYVVFSLYEPRYDSNTHKIFRGFGRHIHEDIFIAKLGSQVPIGRWINYVDMPQEFLSAKSRLDLQLYWTPLVEHRNSMMGSLIA